VSFNRETLQFNYSTDRDNILKSFYVPFLRESVAYDRAVGYFGSNTLLSNIQGIDGLINNGGKMRLIIGDKLTEEEYQAILNTKEINNAISEKLSNTWSELINSASDINNESKEVYKYRLDVLSWLIQQGHLEIKYAFRRDGIFHKKIGIMKDSNNAIITYSGSLNETNAAFSANSEHISVYPNWSKEIYNAYGNYLVNEFESIWNNKEANTLTIDVPSEHYEKIKSIYIGKEAPHSNAEYRQALIFEDILNDLNNKRNDNEQIKPQIPSHLNGVKFEIKEHQLSALNAWKDNDFRGIMALATGSGKTITSIYGAVKVSNNRRIFLIISVPYQVLADQWCEVLSKFNIFPNRCYKSKNLWAAKFLNQITNFQAEITDFECAVVVNATLVTDYFQSKLALLNSSIDNVMFIGDECHHHGNENIAKLLPLSKYRIGLSATPWSRNEIEEKERLTNFYGEIVSEYSLKDALKDDVLTPYDYFIYPVILKSHEEELYKDLSKQMTIILNKKIRTAQDDQIYQNLIFKRSRLLDSLENKFEVLEEILSKKSPKKHTLFYCAAGSQLFVDDEESDELGEPDLNIDIVTRSLFEKNWYVSRFTAREKNNERTQILDNFKNEIIDALVAIKVLDEGFDIPMCKEAFIMASSRNERQFIQRRGRILRKSPGAEKAIVHDFVIFPDHFDPGYNTLVEYELLRIKEFASDASNKDSILQNIEFLNVINTYGIDFDRLGSDYAK